jgi:hypothetical protein
MLNHPPGVYQIKVQGHLSQHWVNWFEGAAIILKDNGDTLLVCSVVDQAALYGLLKKVRDLGLPLVSVIRVQPGTAEMPA